MCDHSQRFEKMQKENEKPKEHDLSDLPEFSLDKPTSEKEIFTLKVVQEQREIEVLIKAPDSGDVVLIAGYVRDAIAKLRAVAKCYAIIHGNTI